MIITAGIRASQNETLSERRAAGRSFPEPGIVSFSVYSVTGELVQTLIDNEKKSAGEHSINIDASGLSNGIYIYLLNVNGTALKGKMTLIK